MNSLRVLFINLPVRHGINFIRDPLCLLFNLENAAVALSVVNLNYIFIMADDDV